MRKKLYLCTANSARMHMFVVPVRDKYKDYDSKTDDTEMARAVSMLGYADCVERAD